MAEVLSSIFKKLVLPASVGGTLFGVVVLWKDYIGGIWHEGLEEVYGRTVVITGANTGIGKLTAKHLAKQGARIIMACNNMEECMQAKEEIYQKTQNKNLECKKLNLSSLRSVREFAEDVKKNEPRIDILINNAGVMGIDPKETTEDNIEAHLGINYLGHFLLTNLLLDKLKVCAPSRIINVSCLNYRYDMIDFEDMNSDSFYDWDAAYGQSKLALVYFTEELDKRLKGTDVQAFCTFPGLAYTKIHRHLRWYTNPITGYIVGPIYWMLMKSAVQAAQSTIYCALDPDVIDRENEKFSLFHQDCEPSTMLHKYYEFDENLSTRLWLTSEVWTGLTKLEPKQAS